MAWSTRELAELAGTTMNTIRQYHRLGLHLVDYPWLSDPVGRLSKSEHVTRETFVDAVVGLYNTPQVDVLGRASVLAQEAAAPRPRDGRRRGSRLTLFREHGRPAGRTR